MAQKRGFDKTKINIIITKLINGVPLPPQNKDHALIGDYSGCRSCHIEPDWLLVYKVSGNELILLRTGSHSDLY